MFAYCINNPVSFADHSGFSARLVGAGIQLEVSIGGATVGLEVIVYWDVNECENGAPVIAVYAYAGISVDVNNAYIGSILGIITDNSDMLLGEDGSGMCVMALAAVISDSFSVSVSGVVILANDSFNSTKDYEKSFTSVGASWGKIKGSVAYSDSCTAISLGASLVGGNSIFPSWGISKTYYQQVLCYSIPNPVTNASASNVGAYSAGFTYGGLRQCFVRACL